MTGQAADKTIQVVICDDHDIVRAGLKSMFNNMESFKVVAEASNGQSGVAAVAKCKPDLLILDVSMPRMNGTEVIRLVKQRSQNTRVLIITMHRGLQHVNTAMSSGADGYALKDDPWEELTYAVNQVLKGNTYLSPKISSLIGHDYMFGSDPKANILALMTPRERQTLKLIAEGLKNREIADFLSVSVKTVDKHRANLMHKLNLHNTAAITAFAIDAGMLV